MTETFYEVMRRQGITRRSFLKYCSLTAAALGLGPAFVPRIAHAMENKPRIPVIWLHGLECTCCSESFIRSAGRGYRPGDHRKIRRQFHPGLRG